MLQFSIGAVIKQKKLWFIVLTIASCHAFAKDYDSNQVIQKDTTNIEPIVSTDKYPDNFIIGGIGVASYFGGSGKIFNTGPVINLGIEFPFTTSHIFSFEILSFLFVAKSTNEFTEWDKEYYNKISENIYLYFGFSALIKYYFCEITERFRISLHLGFSLSSNERTTGLELGIAINYKLNEFSFLNLSYTTHGTKFNNFAIENYLPDLLIINYCHSF